MTTSKAGDHRTRNTSLSVFMGPRLRGDDSWESFPQLGVVPAQAGTHEHARGEAMACYVYILASRRHGTLYIGITNNLRQRIEQHRSGAVSSFTRSYRVYRLVYVETFDDPEAAILREKQLKKWNRDWKIRLIEENNLEWRDLSDLLM